MRLAVWVQGRGRGVGTLVGNGSTVSALHLETVDELQFFHESLHRLNVSCSAGVTRIRCKLELLGAASHHCLRRSRSNITVAGKGTRNAAAGITLRSIGSEEHCELHWQDNWNVGETHESPHPLLARGQLLLQMQDSAESRR